MATKLELNWVGKTDGFALIRDEEGKPYQVPYDSVQPRLLIRDTAYGEENGQDNILIRGENLYALKTLAKSGYAGQVKCCFIDPPYNTGNAFTHYDDALEHSLWLDMMQDRIELIYDLLAKDGSLWISIDDDEGHYLKVMCDEILGRNNFVANVIWQKTHTRENRTDISTVHDNILVFAKDRLKWQTIRNPLPASEAQLGRYSNPDNDPRGVWASLPAHAKAEKGRRQAQFFTITTPSGRAIDPPPGRCWLYTEERFAEMVSDSRIWFGENGSNAPRVKKFLTEVQAGLVPSSIWMHTEVGTTGTAKSQLTSLFPGETPFSTPKPEQLIERVLQIATNPGDLVLDCFAGSGTTAAVALKMDRRFIAVEAGKHCETHIIPRLNKVIDGSDKGGISPHVPPHPSRAKKEVNLLGEEKTENGWTGGGGFTYYTLGKALMERDAETGVWRLNYTNGRMIEAVCLQEGYKLIADGWRHGIRGRHLAHISDQLVTQEMVEAFSAELASEETLTIYYLKSARGLRPPENVELKRLPRDLVPKKKQKRISEKIAEKNGNEQASLEFDEKSPTVTNIKA